MVRLKDIAAVGGVSVMTVSKALRNKPDLSAGTKSRIQALAQQMGYVPDGNGITCDRETVKPYASYMVDDDLSLMLVKQL
jgi:DNA-binding LacI/PurR family transcriptional regulator